MPDYTNLSALQLDGQGGAAGAGLLLTAGTAASPATTATANKRFIDLYTQNTATSGDNRGIYNRFYLSGAGGGGESLRTYTTVNAVAAGTAHGAHISLDFVSASGSGRVTGLGVAMRATLHIPSDASWAPGTIAAVQAEIYSDGTASDTDGATEVSFIRVVNDGHADGIADVDDDAALIAISGGSISSGNMVQAKSAAAVTHVIRIKVNGTPYYLMVSDAV